MQGLLKLMCATRFGALVVLLGACGSGVAMGGDGPGVDMSGFRDLLDVSDQAGDMALVIEYPDLTPPRDLAAPSDLVPTDGPCGAVGQVCCPSFAAYSCSDPNDNCRCRLGDMWLFATQCQQMVPAETICSACGGYHQPCCPGTACMPNLFCFPANDGGWNCAP